MEEIQTADNTGQSSAEVVVTTATADGQGLSHNSDLSDVAEWRTDFPYRISLYGCIQVQDTLPPLAVSL